jgi:hypothetical protein
VHHRLDAHEVGIFTKGEAMRNATATETRTLSVIEEDRVGWRQRRNALAEDLTGAQERQARATTALGALVASQDPDERALKSSRTQRTGHAAEIEELEAGIAAADACLAELATEREAAHRAAQRIAALACIAGAERAAAAVDAAAPAFVQALEMFLLAHREAAAVLGRVNKGARYDILETQLPAVAFWRLSGLLQLPGLAFVSAQERVDLEVFTKRFYHGAREKLMREAAENGGAAQ